MLCQIPFTKKELLAYEDQYYCGVLTTIEAIPLKNGDPNPPGYEMYFVAVTFTTDLSKESYATLPRHAVQKILCKKEQ
jgi:hypothetical protein